MFSPCIQHTLNPDFACRWEKSLGVTSMVNWELFRGWEHLAGLALCFTRAQLRGILERLVKRHRHTRSGFPDLTMWNPEKKVVKVREVLP